MVSPQRRWLVISNTCGFYGRPRLFIILTFQEEAEFDVQHIHIVAALLRAISFGGRCAGSQCRSFCARFRFCRCGSFLEIRVEIVACIKRTPLFLLYICRLFCSSTGRIRKHTIALLMCCSSHSCTTVAFSMLPDYLYCVCFVCALLASSTR